MIWFYLVILITKDILFSRVVLSSRRVVSKKALWSSVVILLLSQTAGVFVSILVYNLFVSKWRYGLSVNSALNASLFENSYVALSGFIAAIAFCFLGLFFVLHKNMGLPVKKVIILSLLGAPYLLLLPMRNMMEVIVLLWLFAVLFFVVPYYLYSFFSNLIYNKRKKKDDGIIDYRIKAVCNALIAEIIGLAAIFLLAIPLQTPEISFPENILNGFYIGSEAKYLWYLPLFGLLVAVICDFCLIGFLDLKVTKKENRKYLKDAMLLTVCNAPYIFFVPIINIAILCGNLIALNIN